MNRRMIIMHSSDNVGVLLENALSGDICENGVYRLTITEEIKFGHKMALQNIPRGEGIIKYGENIGYALVDIKKGQWVHQHNIESERGQ